MVPSRVPQTLTSLDSTLVHDATPYTDDKFVGSASDDRTIRLWPVKALERRPPPCVQFNVDLDHATMLAFAPDGKACVAAMGQEHVLRWVDPDRGQATHLPRVCKRAGMCVHGCMGVVRL